MLLSLTKKAANSKMFAAFISGASSIAKYQKTVFGKYLPLVFDSRPIIGKISRGKGKSMRHGFLITIGLLIGSCGMGAIIILMLFVPLLNEEQTLAVQTEVYLKASKEGVASAKYPMIITGNTSQRGIAPSDQGGANSPALRPQSWGKVQIDLVPSGVSTNYSASTQVTFVDGTSGTIIVFWGKSGRDWTIDHVSIKKAGVQVTMK